MVWMKVLATTRRIPKNGSDLKLVKFVTKITLEYIIYSTLSLMRGCYRNRSKPTHTHK